MPPAPSALLRCRDIEWTSWTPTVRCVLCFVLAGGRILLIRKKRGFGAGKINGPGGKLDPGETARAAAIRETLEEIGVRPLDPAWAGRLQFQFTDSLALHCDVFRATRWEGEPRETEEACPFWAAEDALPFDHMWADDREWFPWLLAGRRFVGRFTFDGDRRLDGVVEESVTPNGE